MRQRIKFLNWLPDLEDEEHQGLTVADNVVHEPEGYKPIHLISASSFATTGGLAASNATVLSAVAKPVGSGNDLLVAWLANGTLHVGLNGVTAASDTTGYPLTFSTVAASGEITVFDVCEAYDKIFFVVKGTQVHTSPTTTSEKSMIGYMSYS